MPAEWPWMRLYSEARVDKKLSILTDAQHRVWFHLLCFAGEQPKRGEIADVDEYELAVECASGDTSLLRETLHILERLRIVRVTSRDECDIGVTERDECDGCDISFLAWEKRQYDKPSDLPDATAERKRRQREKARRDSALPSNKEMSRDVTPGHAPELEQELELEGEISETTSPLVRSRGRYSAEFEDFWSQYPPVTNNSKKKAAAIWDRLSKADRLAAAAALPKYLESEGWPRYAPHTTTWLNGALWQVEPVPRGSPNGHGPEPFDPTPYQQRAREASGVP